MFCPNCGSTQSDELKFCKSCGSNLALVREALITGQAPPKFDWSKTWVAEMLQSSEQAVRKEKELERLKGITPEVKRRNEIKAGVITSSVGIGLMILLFFLMQGIILSGRPSPGAAEILSRIWIAGVIPFFVGVALIINGAFVSKLFSESENKSTKTEAKTTQLPSAGANEYLPPADTNDLFPAGFSVTDETTQHLATPINRRTTD
jgi:hypothetical protein